jgi:hypothetical protein
LARAQPLGAQKETQPKSYTQLIHEQGVTLCAQNLQKKMI